MEDIHIIEVTVYDPTFVPRINELLKQLTPGICFTEQDLRDIVASPSSHLFLLFYNDVIAGMFHFCKCCSFCLWVCFSLFNLNKLVIENLITLIMAREVAEKPNNDGSNKDNTTHFVQILFSFLPHVRYIRRQHILLQYLADRR